MLAKSRKLASPRKAKVLVMAAVNVVLPWSTCPIVPTFTCGFVRSNFCFATLWSSCTRLLERDQPSWLGHLGLSQQKDPSANAKTGRWGVRDSNPRRIPPTGLQPVAVVHLANSPNTRRATLEPRGHAAPHQREAYQSRKAPIHPRNVPRGA